MRLLGGPTSLEGRVEMCVNGGWASICGDGWTHRHAIVVCRQLGFQSIGESQ